MSSATLTSSGGTTQELSGAIVFSSSKLKLPCVSWPGGYGLSLSSCEEVCTHPCRVGLIWVGFAGFFVLVGFSFFSPGLLFVASAALIWFQVVVLCSFVSSSRMLLRSSELDKNI